MQLDPNIVLVALSAGIPLILTGLTGLILAIKGHKTRKQVEEVMHNTSPDADGWATEVDSKLKKLLVLFRAHSSDYNIHIDRRKRGGGGKGGTRL